MTSPGTFVQQTITELKQVTWPTRDTIVRLTLVVIVVSVIVGAYIGGLDYVFTRALQFVINKK